MDEQLQTGNMESIIQQTQEELERKEGAKQLFILEGNPEPERKLVSIWDIAGKFGIEIILRVVSTIGAALVSATAVGAIMQITDTKLREAFTASTDGSGTGIFWWSMFAFEGTLVVAGISKGRKNREIRDSWWPIIFGMLVTVMGGFLRSLTLAGNASLEITIAYVFAGLVALAGPIVSFFGSENIGVLLQEIQNLQYQFDEEWNAKLTEWGEKFRKDYPRIAKQVYGEDRRLRVKFEDEGEDEPRPKKEKMNVRAMVKQYLVQMNIEPRQVGRLEDGAIVTPASIADALALQGSQRDDVRKYISQFRTDQDNDKW